MAARGGRLRPPRAGAHPMLRPATPDDRPALIALGLAEDAAWSDAPAVSAEEAGEYLDGCEPGVILEDEGRVAGYAATGEAGRTILLVDPEDDPGPALEVLVGWLAGRGHHEADSYGRDTRRIAWFEANGFTHRRSFFDLRRDIDPAPAPAAFPGGVELARFRPGEDDEAVHALIYVDAAWTEVPGHSARSLESWRSALSPEDRGWIARRDGRAVGWVCGRTFADGRGWIAQLAVARSARGRGLGRALLLHAMADLRDRGATSLALGVQGANENAVGLYRDVGFEIEREWRAYARPAPGSPGSGDAAAGAGR